MCISVIIPTYKPQSYLWECLQSLCRQTFDKKDFEIILVLNGCGEPYKTEIEQYVATRMQGMNVRFLHTLRPGVSHARNMGLDAATGDFATFIDDDDYVSENYLQGMYETAANGIIPVSNMKAFVDGQPGFTYYEKEEQFQRLKGSPKSINKMRKFLSISVAKLLPMDAVIKGRRFNPSFKNGEDSLFMFLISDNIKQVSCSPDNAIYYRRFRENSALTSLKKRKDIIKQRTALILGYTKIYMSHPTRYNFTFYMTRLIASIKAMIYKQP